MEGLPNTNNVSAVQDILKNRFGHISRKIEEYERIELLGEGTYGEVSKSQYRKTGEIFAVKKIKMDKEKDGVIPIFFILVSNHCSS